MKDKRYSPSDSSRDFCIVTITFCFYSNNAFRSKFKYLPFRINYFWLQFSIRFSFLVLLHRQISSTCSLIRRWAFLVINHHFDIDAILHIDKFVSWRRSHDLVDRREIHWQINMAIWLSFIIIYRLARTPLSSARKMSVIFLTDVQISQAFMEKRRVIRFLGLHGL
jgi:hypothetical protein